MGAAFVASVGAVYVLGKEDGGTWTPRTRIVPPRARQHAYFGYRVVLVGQRLFINFLDDPPKGMSSEHGWGYPSVCEAEWPG